jgi:hypothetical protein
MANLNIKFNNKNYSIDSALLADALASLEGHLVAMMDEPGAPAMLTPGLYQPGAIALMQEQGEEAIADMLITSWDDMLASGAMVVTDGVVSIGTVLPDNLPEKNEYGFYYNVTYNVSTNGVTVGLTLREDGSFDVYQNGALANQAPAGTVIYGDGSIDLSAMDWGVGTVSNDGVSLDFSSTVGVIFTLSETPQLAGDLMLPTDGSIVGFVASTFIQQPLTSITIPDSVTSIGEGAFYNCIALTNIVIGDSVTTIDNGAFYNCIALTNIVIGDSVTSIGNQAFYQCSSLTSVVIPDSVTTISGWAFSNCSGLVNITYNGTIAQWNAIEKEPNWNKEVPATHVHCTDGDVAL